MISLGSLVYRLGPRFMLSLGKAIKLYQNISQHCHSWIYQRMIEMVLSAFVFNIIWDCFAFINIYTTYGCYIKGSENA